MPKIMLSRIFVFMYIRWNCDQHTLKWVHCSIRAFFSFDMGVNYFLRILLYFSERTNGKQKVIRFVVVSNKKMRLRCEMKMIRPITTQLFPSKVSNLTPHTNVVHSCVTDLLSHLLHTNIHIYIDAAHK